MFWCTMKSYAINVLVIGLLLVVQACYQNPELPKAYDSAKAGDTKAAHEHFQQAILQGKGDVLPFNAYIRWQIEALAPRLDAARQEFDQASEATFFDGLQTSMHELLQELRGTEEFLREHCQCDRQEDLNSFNWFRQKAQEHRNLAHYLINESKLAAKKYRTKSNRLTISGENYYRSNQFGPAFDALDKALRYDIGNRKAAELLANIERYRKGTELIEGVQLKQADEHFMAMVADGVLVQAAKGQLDLIKRRRIMSQHHIHQAEMSLARKQFSAARKSFSNAKSLDRDLEELLSKRIVTVALLEEAWLKTDQNNYEQALELFRQAEKDWPENKTIQAWRKRSEAQVNHDQAKRLVAQGETLLLAGQIEDAEKAFAAVLQIPKEGRRAKRDIRKARTKARKQFVKQAQKATKDGDKLTARNKYRLCYEASQYKPCMSKQKALEKKLIGGLLKDGKKALEAKESFLAYAAFQAVLQMNGENADAQAGLQQAQEACQPASSLVLHLDSEIGHTVDPTWPSSLEEVLKAKNLRFHWANPEETSTTPGRHVLITVLAPAPPARETQAAQEKSTEDEKAENAQETSESVESVPEAKTAEGFELYTVLDFRTVPEGGMATLLESYVNSEILAHIDAPQEGASAKQVVQRYLLHLTPASKVDWLSVASSGH